MDPPLHDQVAIITGSSKGLGFASARALAEEGCRVVLCARGQAPLDQAAAPLRHAAKRDDAVLAVQADVATNEGAEMVVSRTIDRFGRIDILVNNVGKAGG